MLRQEIKARDEDKLLQKENLSHSTEKVLLLIDNLLLMIGSRSVLYFAQWISVRIERATTSMTLQCQALFFWKRDSRNKYQVAEHNNF